MGLLEAIKSNLSSLAPPPGRILNTRPNPRYEFGVVNVNKREIPTITRKLEWDSSRFEIGEFPGCRTTRRKVIYKIIFDILFSWLRNLQMAK